MRNPPRAPEPEVDQLVLGEQLRGRYASGERPVSSPITPRASPSPSRPAVSICSASIFAREVEHVFAALLRDMEEVKS